MKSKKGSLLQRMTAVLLSAVLVAGMAWDAAPASVLAQENASSPEEDEARGGGEEAGVIEEKAGSGGGNHDSESGESENEGGEQEGESRESGSVSGNDAEVAEQQRVMMMAAEDTHEHNGVPFTAWTKTDSLPTAPGNYYLTDNVTLSGTWTVPSGTTSICLNGKTIRAEGKSRVITIMASNTLNLYDCTGSGIITGGQKGGVQNSGIFHMYGGRISENNTSTDTGAGIYSKGDFYLHGGEISNNTTAYYGGGVYNKGTFYMYGGRIADNTAGIYGGGVENGSESTFYMYDGEITGNRAKLHGGVVNDTNGNCYLYGGIICGNSITDTDKTGAGVQHQGKSITVGGSIVIKDNTNGNGESSNLYIQATRIISIDSSRPLTEGAYIGITSGTVPTEQNTPSITGVNDADYSRYFYSDKAAYVIVDGENHNVQLALPHTHTLTRTEAKGATCTQAGNTAYYVCSGKSGCGKWFSDEKGTNEIADKSSVVIAASGHSYDTSTWGYQGVDGHARKCSKCNEHDKASAHTPGAAATETTAQTCTVCGYVIQPALGHTCSPQPVAKTEPGCTTAGKQAYYKCKGCGKNYEDKNGTTLIKDIDAWGNIDALGHEWGGWTETKPATATTAGSKERTCSRCNNKETETIPATGSSGDSGNQGGSNPGGNDNNGGNSSGGNSGNNGGGNNSDNNNGNGQTAYDPATAPVRVTSENQGNIVKEVTIKAEDTFNAAIAEAVSELADIVLTQEEKELAAAGANIKIVLDIQDAQHTVSAADKAVVESALNTDAAQGFNVGQYLDVNLFKIINDNRSAIYETDRKIIVTMAVPDRLKNTGTNRTRTFVIVRVHNGMAEVLEDLDDSDDTISIATDRFSTYAIVYKDMAGNGVNDNGIAKNQKDKEPKTGDSMHVELYATLSMVAGLTYVLMYFADRERGMSEEKKKELVSRLIGWAKRGGKIRRGLALAAIFVLLVYYHSIGKKTCVEWKEIYVE